MEPISIDITLCMHYADSYNRNYSFLDFPEEDRDKGYCDYWETFTDKGPIRHGDILQGYKQGKWVSGAFESDTIQGEIYITHLQKEEYFKDGLRDSTFTIFDDNDNIIYSTHFNMGTGVLKDFYDNGQSYFEINTKDGYFTDTLRLYTRQGKLKERLLYKKDSLIFHQTILNK